MKKGLSTILLIVIILAVGVIAAIGGYYYGVKVATPTTTTTTSKITTTVVGATTTAVDTANWKTYKSDRFKWQAKYPNTGSVGEIPTGEKQFGGDDKLGSDVSFTIIPNDLNVKVYAYDNSLNAKTLEELIQGKSEGENRIGVPLFVDDHNKYTVTDINGQRAFQYITSYGDLKENGLNTLLLGEKYYYQITTIAGYMDNPKNLTTKQKNTYNQFVSTFQILK